MRDHPPLTVDREEMPGCLHLLLSARLFGADSLISQHFSCGGAQRHKEIQNPWSKCPDSIVTCMLLRFTYYKQTQKLQKLVDTNQKDLGFKVFDIHGVCVFVCQTGGRFVKHACRDGLANYFNADAVLIRCTFHRQFPHILMWCCQCIPLGKSVCPISQGKLQWTDYQWVNWSLLLIVMQNNEANSKITGFCWCCQIQRDSVISMLSKLC